MLFAFYDEQLESTPFLCVDGVVPGGLNLSHWPGNRTPAHLKADTSTEMALRLARDPHREEWLRGVSVVTNNHFDTDGLLSAYAAMHPDEALRHEREMVQAARAGDFGEFTTPEAFKFDAVVTGFDDDERSPIASEFHGLADHERYQVLYDRLLSMLPGLLHDTGAYKHLWAGPLASLLRSMMLIKLVARVREHPEACLTVIETSRPLERAALFNVARHHRVLIATPQEEGRNYEMAYRIFSWFDTLTPARGSRLDLRGVAAAFDRLETKGMGLWTYTGNDALDARLYRAGPAGEPVPSFLPIGTVEDLLVRTFSGRP